MSETYKGYELNTAGDKNWATREENLHKAQIDLDETQTTQIASLTSHFHNGTVEVPINTLTSIGVPFISAEYKFFITTPPLPMYKQTFSVSSLPVGWSFDAGITHELINFEGRDVLHINIPANNTGTVKYQFLAPYATTPSNVLGVFAKGTGMPVATGQPIGFTLWQDGNPAGGTEYLNVSTDWNILTGAGGPPYAQNKSLTFVMSTLGGSNSVPIDIYLEYFTVSSSTDTGIYQSTILMLNNGTGAVSSDTSSQQYVEGLGAVLMSTYGTPDVVTQMGVFNNSRPQIRAYQIDGKLVAKIYHPTRQMTVNFVQTTIVP